MPKKFQGENTKSAAARARKAEAKAAADAKRQQELEDAYWKDEDKHVMRKEQRKVRGWQGGGRRFPGCFPQSPRDPGLLREARFSVPEPLPSVQTSSCARCLGSAAPRSGSSGS